MRPRFIVLGTLVAAIVLFVWQSISNAALPWYEMQMKSFQDTAGIARKMRSEAPTNGIYVANEGIVAVVSMDEKFTNKQTLMGPMLGKQFALDLIVAFGLCLLIYRFPAQTVGRTGSSFALAAALVTAVVEVSNVIWYGFPEGWAAVSIVDQAISFGLAGLTLRWLANKTSAIPSAATAGVRAEGGLASPGVGAPR